MNCTDFTGLASGGGFRDLTVSMTFKHRAVVVEIADWLLDVADWVGAAVVKQLLESGCALVWGGGIKDKADCDEER